MDLLKKKILGGNSLTFSKYGLLLLIFIFSTFIILNIFTYYNNINWQFLEIFLNPKLQNVILLTWGSMALIMMVYSKIYKLYHVWYIVSLIFFIIMLKFLFIDLSYQSTLIRIISFMCSGILLRLIGYLAPTNISSKPIK
ncbi:MAG: putative rane protein [Francisellaceae bacterium]|nr:putative rane protein [Francisellaceae bacterium]